MLGEQKCRPCWCKDGYYSFRANNQGVDCLVVLRYRNIAVSAMALIQNSKVRQHPLLEDLLLPLDAGLAKSKMEKVVLRYTLLYKAFFG